MPVLPAQCPRLGIGFARCLRVLTEDTMASPSPPVVALFADKGQGQAAMDALRRAGFAEDQLGLIARGETGDAEVSNSATLWSEGAVAGGVAGAGVGGLWALGVAANVMPPIGPAIVGGLFLSMLAS